MKTRIYLKSIPLLAAFALLFVACNSEGDKFDYNKRVILVTGTETTPFVKFVVEDTPASYVVTASATGKVSEDITVAFAQDNSLIDAYNAAHKTSYYAIPSSAVEIDGTEGVIKAGRAASTGITVRIVSTEDFRDGRTYVIPITIKEVKGGDLEVLSASKTIFLRVSRVIKFNSLNMNNTNLYSNYIAPDALAVDLPNYTYEIKCYINSWHTTPERISRLCSFTSKTETGSNMLRFGENGQDINSLQWVSPGGGLISTTRFNTAQWYTISLTYDGSKFVMYVDGVKDCELSGSATCTFQRFELGMSWETYPAKQYFSGRVAEVRVWNRALTTSELKLGICGVDPTAEGLVAYWKMNEGEGHIFRDATNHGYDMDWSITWRDNTGNGTLNQFDKSSAVGWLMDDINKCNQ